MTNVVTRFGFAERLPVGVAVSTGGTAFNAGWSTVLRIPASRFVANHTYALVLTGMIGDFAGCLKQSPTYEVRAEISFREGGASYWSHVEHRIDPMIPALAWESSSFSEAPSNGRGLPFQFIVRYDVPATPVDLELIARFTWAPSLTRGVHFQAGSFMVDQLSVLAWDLDVLTSSPLSRYFLESWNTSDWNGGVPLETPPVSILSHTDVPGGAWFCAWSCLICPDNAATGEGPTAELITNSTPARPWATHPKVHYAQATNPLLFTDRYWMGQQGLLSYGGAWTPALRVEDARPGYKGRIYRAELLLVDVTLLDPFLQVCAPSAGAGGFFIQDYRGHFDFHRREFTSHNHVGRVAFMSSTRCSAQVGCAQILEVDSGELFRPSLGAIASRTRGALPGAWCGVPQAAGGVVEIGVGEHGFLARGKTFPRDEGRLSTDYYLNQAWTETAPFSNVWTRNVSGVYPTDLYFGSTLGTLVASAAAVSAAYQWHYDSGTGVLTAYSETVSTNPTAAYGSMRLIILGPSNLDPTDLWIYGFALEHHSDPPVSTYEEPGDPVPVDPGRESGLDVAAMPVLPHEPSWSLQVSYPSEVRSIEFPSGYKVTHPRFLRMRRIYQLRWVGLASAEADELAEFFRDNASGAWAWTPPGSLAASGWVLDPQSFRRDGSSTIEATVLELVFVGVV